MRRKDGLKTVAQGYGRSGPFVCWLCGESAKMHLAEVRLIDPEAPTDWRTLCPTCVDAGPAGAAERVRARAKDAPEPDARELLALAERVAKIKAEDWATSRDLARAAYERERGFRPVTLDKPTGASPAERQQFQRYRKSKGKGA